MTYLYPPKCLETQCRRKWCNLKCIFKRSKLFIFLVKLQCPVLPLTSDCLSIYFFSSFLSRSPWVNFPALGMFCFLSSTLLPPLPRSTTILQEARDFWIALQASSPSGQNAAAVGVLATAESAPTVGAEALHGSCCSLDSFYLPGAIHPAFHSLSHLIFTTILWLHFTDKDAETPSVEITLPTSHVSEEQRPLEPGAGWLLSLALAFCFFLN